MEIQLASKSPRRRELLGQIGVRYRTVDVDVPEEHEAGESPEAYVSRLALSKARAGAHQSTDGQVFNGPTLGADTIVVCGDEILEKPQNFDDFKRMMSVLSGGLHRVMTAVALCKDGRELLDCSSTQVRFRDISEDEMFEYWQTEEPRDKAGGYAIQGLGAVFVIEIIGSYSGVVGLPIETLSPMLAEFSIPVWNS